MTFSTGIYRRLDFGISISDECDERVSEQKVEVGVPTRKRKISDFLSFEEDSNFFSPARRSPRIEVKALTSLLVKEKTTIYSSEQLSFHRQPIKFRPWTRLRFFQSFKLKRIQSTADLS